MKKEQQLSLERTQELGLYIHIPFCKRKCLYCDFPSYAGKECLYHGYTEALIAEIKEKASLAEGQEIKSVFFGGGTPTVLAKEDIGHIMEAIRQHYHLKESAELSIEANPGTIDLPMAEALISFGFNRLSMGLQAWQNHLLKLLGRIHTREEFLANFQLARQAGFSNINVDLMFALPTQTQAEWEETVEAMIALGPEHISAYSLIIEEGTPFYDLFEGGQFQEMDEELDRRLYHWTGRRLAEAGYHQYEISNYAKDGRESVHNKIYWETTPYLAFGLGAHSYIEGERFHNTYDLKRYIAQDGTTSVEEEEREDISKEEAMAEFMFMGLRMKSGVKGDLFHQRFGREMQEVYGEQIEKLVAEGLLQTEGNRIFLTEWGIDLSNQVFLEFLY